MRLAWVLGLGMGVLACARGQDLASNVDMFIGTGVSPVNDNGLTMPAAALPFGMLAWGPDPADDKFYHYAKTNTRGFSLTHISGVGCEAFGDFPILPVDGEIGVSPALEPMPYVAHYKHADEVTSPGFYSVKLDSGVTVELAAGLRAGMATFGFPADGKVHSLLVDMSRTMDRFRVKDAEVKARGRAITGWVKSGGFCAKANEYKAYFALESEEEPLRTCTFDALGVADVEERAGSHVGGCMSFAAGTREVHVRVGLSYVSADAARANLRAEIVDWDQAKLRGKGNAVWNEALSRAVVVGGTNSQRRVYYTALYHSLLHPSLFSDADGRYIGFDEKIHTLAAGRRQYANFSSWDIYRSQVQLVAMLFPDVASDLAQSLVNDAQEGGGFPRWPMANDDTEVMTGDPSDIILAEIYEFGARNFDTKAALALMIRGADDPSVHARLYLERHELADYLSKGYVVETAHSEGSAATTLEYANADFAISRMAAAMGEQTTAARMLERSANWRKLFDAETKYIRPRGEDGKFLEGFTPGSGKGFVEGNSAQYTWMVPYDFPGVIAAIGGDAAANARLDDYFSQYARFGGGPNFLISNEPCFSSPWIYNWTGEPWRTDEVVTKTLKDLFTDSPGGIPGNDDVGATSAWAVFAQLGIYPAVPGVAGFTLNTPVFPEARLKVGGHTVKIVASGNGAYLGNVTLGDKAITNYWISWEEFRAAEEMNFHTVPFHNVAPTGRPPSFATGR